MRSRIFVVLTALLLFTVSFASAQQTRIAVYATDVEHTSSDLFGSHWSGGGALSLNRFWTPRFSTAIWAGAERYYSGYTALDPSGHIVAKGESGYTVYPFDLLAQYHFARDDSRWKPYIGAGIHYENASRGQHLGLGPEINSGVMFAMTPRLGLVFDGRLALYKPRNAVEISGKPSLGLSWRF